MAKEMKLEEQKKVIMPAIGRAQEMEKAGNSKIAYYCYLYAVIKGMDVKDRHPKIDGIVKSLIEKLEQMRQVVQPDKEADAAIVEDFALRLFTEADRVDRAGRANKLTAHKFYAACNFLEILTQFSPDGTLEPDLLEKQRYALWKSTEINKALREGRAPTAGPMPKPDPLADIPPASDVTAALSGPEASIPPPPPTGFDQPPGRALEREKSFSFGKSGAQPPPPPPLAGPYTPVFTGAGQPRYGPGQKVYHFKKGSSATPRRGTVAKVTQGGTGWTYTVALSDCIADAGEETLAPDFNPGDAVLYTKDDGGQVEACISGMDLSCWRPSYSLVYGDIEVDTTDDRLTRMVEEIAQMPSSEAAGAQQGNSDGQDVQPTAADQSGLPGMASQNPHVARQGPEHGGSGAGDARGGQPFQGFEHPANPGSMDPASWDSGATQSPSGPAEPGAYPQQPAWSDAGRNGNSEPAPPPAPPASSGQWTTYPPPDASRSGAPHHSAGQPSGAYPGPSSMPQHGSSSGASPAATHTAPPGFQPSTLAQTEAQKFAKYAVSSLSFDDVNAAVKYLNDALRLLTDPSAPQPKGR